ncbi:MAG: hypothetical protein ACI846_003278 [Pseudoalteromonas distincta]|jgi:hypothetical protein
MVQLYFNIKHQHKDLTTANLFARLWSTGNFNDVDIDVDIDKVLPRLLGILWRMQNISKAYLV